MAIALTPFRGFCGFLPLPTLLLLLSTIPELRSLIGESPIEELATSLGLNVLTKDANKVDLDELVEISDNANTEHGSDFVTTIEQKTALKKIFQVLMTSSTSSVKTTIQTLLDRYETDVSSCKTLFESNLVDLVKELHEQYPDDVGVLCTFVLNVVELGVGKAVFLRADEPHAYISGGEWAANRSVGSWSDGS
jgi:mannose-6-phosphate isomerase